MTHSLLETLAAAPQFLRGAVPVFFRRSVRTASGLPQRVSQDGDVLVPEHRDAMFIQEALVRLPGMLVSLLGVLQSLPGALLPGFVILFLMGFGGATVGVRGKVVQLGGPLVVFVMRSVIVTSRHLETHYLP